VSVLREISWIIYTSLRAAQWPRRSPYVGPVILKKVAGKKCMRLGSDVTAFDPNRPRHGRAQGSSPIMISDLIRQSQKKYGNPPRSRRAKTRTCSIEEIKLHKYF
jgi:hypothetical protein